MPVAKRTLEPSKDGSAKKQKAGGSIMSFFGAPKGGSSLSSVKSSPASKFNKDEWIASLTPEQTDLLKLEIETLDPEWMAALKDQLVTKEFLDLKKFLKQEINSGAKVFPPAEDVYSWSRYTPLHQVKVLVVGQDPYHGLGQAHGLCFSVRPPTPAPPSLKNIFTAVAKDYPDFQRPPNNGGLLTPWAERGVLLLNTCLTVRAHQANSHAKRGWEQFTQKVIDIVAARRTQGVVFMAWGSPAAQRVAKVDRNRHLVLQAVHPSPLSAYRGFLTCGHFKKANQWLVQRYGEDGAIDWSLVPSEPKTETEGATAESAEKTAGPAVEPVNTASTAPLTKKKSKEEFDDDELEALLASEEGLS
ncbi:hypothetical protein KEM56_003651 [Ascosphaera pollenicola]|nr:hypothetical protein KEM56_003651 [Ascosphaera pollenicola]